MGGEVVAHIGEVALCGGVHAYGFIVILRPGHGQYDVYHVVYEERCEYDKGRAVEVFVPPDEEEQRHDEYHREVGSVAEVHQFAEHGAGQGAAEEQRRLASEELLLPCGEVVVEVWEHAVELVGVRVPP